MDFSKPDKFLKEIFEFINSKLNIINQNGEINN